MELSQLAQAIREKFPEAIIEEQKTAIVLKKESLVAVARFLKDSDLSFSNLHCVTAVDWKNKIELIYHLYSFKHKIMLTLKIFLTLEDLTVESLAGIWRSADWLEREVFDLFGVKFLNHPDLRRILNPDEWTYYPLRKDFSHPEFIRKPETPGLKGA